MAKSAPAVPIDRPLSKAYLREFEGWSTVYPPGISAPNSLRLMKNVWVTREGAVSVRPGLRSIFAPNVFLDVTHSQSMVGSFEHFYLNDGSRAILYAYRRSPDNRVAFSCAVYNEAQDYFEVKALTDVGFSIPQGMTTLSFSAATKYVRYVQIDNKILALSDAGEPARLFWVGATKSARKVTALNRPAWTQDDRLAVVHPTATWINAATKNTIPAAQATTANTLIHSTAADNDYNFAYFYTFFNEVGETAGSQITLVKTQRGYSLWKMTAPESSGNPSNSSVSDPVLAMDQLVATLPADAYSAAKTAGALGWNLYGFSWSDQGNVPVEAILIGSKSFTTGGSRATEGWMQHTPLIAGQDIVMPLPRADVRDNYSEPPTASQGLVVGDRIILTYDKANAARVQWSSNQMGEYINFSSSKGGGYKTLTAGNLQVPAAVKLWQNPMSVDTITIMCMGLDGYSTAYYMNPNTEVTGQATGISVVGFEETTATPGTTSPFGAEVLNNALYHPLDPELMKSTASNYTINHSSMTELIQNKWRHLRHKENIVSSQLDNRLYYIVHNPDGDPLEAGCMGNEVWVCDTSKDGKWSRWAVQGHALRKIDLDGRLYMSICRPEGIFVFDDQRGYDERPGINKVINAPIPWSFETNTQGANRAHDAWAVLQQANVTFGTFFGTVTYGVRGVDVNGKRIEVSKTFRQLEQVDLSARPMPFDISDYFLIRRTMKEWFFFAEAAKDQFNQVLPSYGQINHVQYTYLPASVNVGYEFGSVETHEYGRSQANWAARTTDNGVPIPFLDTGRP